MCRWLFRVKDEPELLSLVTHTHCVAPLCVYARMFDGACACAAGCSQEGRAGAVQPRQGRARRAGCGDRGDAAVRATPPAGGDHVHGLGRRRQEEPCKVGGGAGGGALDGCPGASLPLDTLNPKP
eukprot:354707-Chlamydomonas_euryale.AAC.2